MSRPLNYTTKVPVSQTVHECMALLAAAGADRVTVSFDGEVPSGLGFTLKTPHGPRHFALPVRLAAVQKRIGEAVTADRPHVSAAQLARYRSPAHAAMVAWRVLRDWLAVTLDMLATEAVSLDEVMLGWLQVGEERGEPVTLYENYKRQESAALEAGS